jgi:hypothetical protein
MKNFRYAKKRAMSMKQFITEYGESFSEHIKEKLMELESRSFLIGGGPEKRFELEHVEHLKYECKGKSEEPVMKEYAYAEFQILEDGLYFSKKCKESDKVMQSPVVEKIYNSLESQETAEGDGRQAKKIDDNNIDYIVDSILAVCPEVSQRYLEIIKGMSERADNKNAKF